MLSDEPFAALTLETNRILSQAITEGFADNLPPELMVKALKDDVFLFSGLKTHAQLKEASELLLNEDGTLKLYKAFEADIISLHEAYNIAHLEPEYIFATSSAQTAADWAQWQSEGSGRYNLQYRTAGDDRVRDSHAVLDNTTLPDDDPFWMYYITPLGWRCRCRTVQVRKGKYPTSDPDQAMKAGDRATTILDKNGNNSGEIFRFNPGVQKVIFPPKHPYYKTSESVKNTIQNLPR